MANECPDDNKKNKSLKKAFKNLGSLILSIVALLVGAKGVAVSATFIANALSIPIVLVGALIVGLGNCLPEMYFAVSCAKKKDNWMILGNLMGSVIICATLVLGVVAIIQPIVVKEFSAFFIARIFLFVSTLFFIIFLRKDKDLTRKEGIFLLTLYALFVLSEIGFHLVK